MQRLVSETGLHQVHQDGATEVGRGGVLLSKINRDLELAWFSRSALTLQVSSRTPRPLVLNNKQNEEDSPAGALEQTRLGLVTFCRGYLWRQVITNPKHIKE